MIDVVTRGLFLRRYAVPLVLSLGICACGDSDPSTGAGDGGPTTDADGGPTPSADSGTTLPPTASGLLSGVFTLDEFGDFLSPEYFGVIEVDASPAMKRRLLDGSKPRRLADGSILYRRPCGQFVTQIMLADPTLRSRELTPCSSNVPIFDTTARVQFIQSALSADQTTLATEAAYYDAGIDSTVYATVVFSVETQTLLARWDGARAPVWLPSGRLLLASDAGLMQLDANFDNPTLLGDITGPVDNPSISPDQTYIAFEHNQQVWGMNIDGTESQALVIGGSRLRYPVWSPDGRPIVAYLSNTGGDDYEEAIYVTDVVSGENAVVDMDPLLPGIHTVNGPLSWTE